MRLLPLLGSLALSTIAPAGEPGANPGFTLDQYGLLSVDGFPISVEHRDTKWQTTSQNSKSVKLNSSDTAAGGSKRTISGTWKTKDGEFVFSEEVSGLGTDAAKLGFTIDGIAKSNTAEFGLQLKLPVKDYAGAEITAGRNVITLPETPPADKLIAREWNLKSLELPMPSGKLVIKGNFNLILQDGRACQHDFYTLRLYTNLPEKAAAVPFDLELAFERTMFQSVDLSKAANMKLKDDVADDRKGGWTDQGPDNDLRMLPPGKRLFSGVEFQITDSCVALAGKDRAWLPRTASVETSGSWRNLFLLHTLAWGGSDPGVIKLRYQDGSSQCLNVGNGDVGNWWAPVSKTNGIVAWTGENRSSYVGLYLSKYRIENKPLSSIAFESNGGPVWLIVGATLSNGDVLMPGIAVSYIVSNNDWRPVELKQDFQKGSILDFSHLQDAPAGKHGRVIVNPSGNFAFADTPDKTQRFYGVNLVGDLNYPDKEWSDRLADRLAMSGYNSVRLHHYDNDLVRKDTGNRMELNPQTMDRLDRLFYNLKERGIYITIDLYVSRQLRAGDIPEIPELTGRAGFKGLIFVLDSAMDNWKEFSRLLLTHVNPYTGLAWKDDPALMTIVLVNEGTIDNSYHDAAALPFFQRAYDEWCKKKGFPAEGEKSSNFQQFLFERYREKFAEMRKFLESLGVKCPISDQNMCQTVPLTVERSDYDFVDNHFYWDHPSFPGKDWLPFGITGRNFIKAQGSWLDTIMSSRILGLPFTISEFDFVSPNPFRAESGPLMGAYAALQDWSGLYRFAYAHHLSHLYGGTKLHFNACFDLSVDPVKALSDRIGILEFLRGDISTSSECIASILSSDIWQTPPDRAESSDYMQLGYICRRGTMIVAPDAKPVHPLPKGLIAVNCLQNDMRQHNWGVPDLSAGNGNLEKSLSGKLPAKTLEEYRRRIFISSTGELTRNGETGAFQAVSPRSETLIVPENMRLTGKRMSVENQKTWAVFSAAAMDGRSLENSERILLLHLTDSQFNKTKFGNREQTLLMNWGELPVLIRAGKAVVELKGEYRGFQLYAVDLSGKRIDTVPFRATTDGIVFTVQSDSPKGSVMAYELVKE